MEKKMVGILAGVAAVHAVLLAGLLASGGCRQPEILGTQTYNDGPAMERVPAASDALPAAGAPTVPGGAEVTVPAASAAPAAAPLPGLNTVPPATRTAAAAPSAGAGTYKVVKGDTLSGIAYKHGVKTRELAACNNLDVKSVLRIGQELKIPAGGAYAAPEKTGKTVQSKPAAKAADKSGAKGTAAKTAALPADGIHVVAAGDSLDKIGRKYGVSAKAIAAENDIALTKVLHIGDKLRIPAKGAKADKDAKNAATGKTAQAAASASLDDLNPDLPVGGAGQSAAAAPAGTETPGANAAASPLTNTESLQVPKDMSAEEFCKMYNVKLDDLKRLNPDLAADGQLKGGAYMIVPRL